MTIGNREPHFTALPGALAALTFCRVRPAPGRMVMPDICCDLVWARGRLALTGPTATASYSRNVGHAVQLLRLDPLVARAWLRTPLILFTEVSVSLAEIAPRQASELEPLNEAGQLAALVRPAGNVVEAGVDPRLVAAVRAVRSGLSVARVAEMVSLSERQLERLFVHNLGLAPKVFARIIRLRRALGHATAGASLVRSAAAAGYADQAHFSRDVAAFTGTNPRALLPNVGNVQDIVAGDM